MSYKDRYWRTLIQLKGEEDREYFRSICNFYGVSQSKLMGEMIRNIIVTFTNVREEKNE